MDHLLEVMKIVDGAIGSDRRKVATYAEQLATKLEAAGERRAAEGIRRALRREAAPELSAARLGQSLPVDGESRLALADERRYSVHDVSLFLDEQTGARVTEFIACVRASDRLLANGVGLAPSLLVHGPPGTGKSELAKHIAAQLELPLLTARTDALISSFLGSTSKNLRSLFEHAMSRPCVLFLDEFDAVAKLRDDQHELGELKRVVVSLLQNIDALDSKTVLLAATNHEHLLDPAIWRRFAFRLRLGLPSGEVRLRLFEHSLGAHAPENLDLRALAHAADGLSGADIKGLCEDARREGILANAERASDKGLLLRFARARVEGLDQMTEGERIAAMRGISSKLFTVRRLAEMFSVSTGKISMLMRKGAA